MSIPFVGRQDELESLKKLFKKNTSSLVVIQGRRRIGKSRLVQEFAKDYIFYQFSGLPPTKETTAQSQRNEFSRQLSTQVGIPEVFADDWSKLFQLFSERIQNKKTVILLDEISWMGDKDPDFLGKLKNAWDLQFKNHPKLILILCGSASTWIEKNIVSSTAFVGRISYKLILEELPLSECSKFWVGNGHYVSPYEKLKILSITGGVPRYLEEIKPSLPAEENIKDLCFTKGGLLVDEFNIIFSDLFSSRSPTYKKIVQTLSNGSKTIKEICQEVNLLQTGYISDCLEDLVKCGFITRDYTWHLQSKEISRLSHFRLSDNYLRFYLKYIDKNIYKIENNAFVFKSLASLPAWESIMALQFENLVLKNRQLIKAKLGIKPEEVISDNPFFQRTNSKQPGCQIDYLIHTKFGTLYLCEIKFSKNLIQPTVILEMQEKIKRFKYPKGFSCRPILIHVNGVHEDVIESEYFAEIINFEEFL